MLWCMRTTLSLDDDVAKLLEQVRKTKNASQKEIVNQALREGLAQLSHPASRKPFKMTTVDLGECYFPNLDNIWEVIADVEGDSAK